MTTKNGKSQEFLLSSFRVDRGSYVLDENGEPRHEPDLLAWAMWMQTANKLRRLARDTVKGLCVSTLFLGLDMRLGLPGHNRPPLLWETMVFAGDGEPLLQVRYTSRALAEAGHKDVVERINKLTPEQIKNGDIAKLED